MPNVMLTLHYLKGLRGVPMATTTDVGPLRYSKRTVLDERKQRIDDAVDEGEALLDRLGYRRFKTALNLFVSDDEEECR